MNTNTPRRRCTETTPERLIRLISLVTLLTQRGSLTVHELAAHFNVTPQQIRTDIDLLWVTGTPGYMPDDLVDFDADALENGVVTLTTDRGLARSLNLGTRETIALVAALHALANIITTPDPNQNHTHITAINQLTTKLSLHLGHTAQALDLHLGNTTTAPTLATLRQALTTNTPVTIDYISRTDQKTHRTVEPAAIFNEADNFYLAAYCRRARGNRVFKIDRIVDAQLVTGERYEPSEPEEQPSAHIPKSGTTAHLTLRPQGQRIAESIPYERIEYGEDGTISLDLDVADWAWFQGLLLAHAPLLLDVQPAHALQDSAQLAQAALDLYAGLHPEIFDDTPAVAQGCSPTSTQAEGA